MVNVDLARYRALIRSTQRRLGEESVFSDVEQAAILDALNGTLLHDRPEMLAGSVADALALDGLDEKWGVERHAMKEKLAALTPLEMAAVADAAERFWSAAERRGAEGGLFSG